MAYTKNVWKNSNETGKIAINKTNLNHMEQGIYDAHLYGSDSGLDDTYILNLDTTLTEGMTVKIKVTTGNTGSCSLSIDNGVISKPIKKSSTSGLVDLSTNEIPAGSIITLVYNGTYWQLQNVNYSIEINTHINDYTLQIPWGGTSTNSGNNYSISQPTISALSAGMAVSFKCNADSTGASTLNWNGKGAKTIKKANGVDMTYLKNGGIYTVRYDGTNFMLQGEGARGNATPEDLALGKIATVDSGEITGIAYVLPSTLSAGTNVISVAIDQYKNSNGFYTVMGDSVQKSAEIQVKRNGTIRVSFEMSNVSGQTGHYVRGQVYKNGSAIGTLRSMDWSQTSFVNYTQDFTVASNDLIQLYNWGSYSGTQTRVRNLKIAVYETIPTVADVTFTLT